MNYASLRKADIANGPGFRVSLFVSGCERRCRGCFNVQAQNPKYGKRFDDDAKKRLFGELAMPTCDGISYLGGDPLSKYNRATIIQLAKEIRERFPEKSQWLWTGWRYDEVLSDPTMRPILEHIDVLVDGEFVEGLKDLSRPWRGSSNQRVVDVPESLRRGSLVEVPC